MRTHNICFHAEIRTNMYPVTLISGYMDTQAGLHLQYSHMILYVFLCVNLFYSAASDWGPHCLLMPVYPNT